MCKCSSVLIPPVVVILLPVIIITRHNLQPVNYGERTRHVSFDTFPTVKIRTIAVYLWQPVVRLRILAVLECYSALLTDVLGLQIRPIGCPEMSVNKYESTLLNIPEQRRPQSHRSIAEISHSSIST
jgi:hypothetical protein